MELPATLKCASVVTDLLGAAFGLITNIKQALEKARQNKAEYQHLKHHLPLIGYALHRLPADPELGLLLPTLINTLQQAYDVVIRCEKRSAANQLFRANIHADRLRLVNARIDSHLSLINMTGYAAITRRLDDKPSCSCAGSVQKVQDVSVPERNILEIVPLNHAAGEVQAGWSSLDYVQDVEDLLVAGRKPDHTGEVPGYSSAGSMQNWEDLLVEELKPNHTGGEVQAGCSSAGSLQDVEDLLAAERKPDHTGEVPGCSSAGSMQNWEDLLMAGLKPNHTGGEVQAGCSSLDYVQDVDDLLAAERKPDHTGEVPACSSAGSMQNWEDLLMAGLKPNYPGDVQGVGVLVYDQGHMSNNTLRDHLVHGVWSPVTESWRTRMEVLLGASRAIEHLHRCAIIHGNVSSSNIHLDGSCTPRLSGFLGVHVLQADQLVAEVVGMPGYIDPEYHRHRTGRMSPASDVYGFGVVILEALTGRALASGSWENGEDAVTLLVESRLPVIRDGNLRAVLDGRPVLQPMLHLDALELVAHTAMLCLWTNGKDRPPISNVTANLERALGIMSSNGPMKVL